MPSEAQTVQGGTDAAARFRRHPNQTPAARCKKARYKQGNTNGSIYVRPCGWIYDEELGDPEHGIAPGTKFEDIPDDWKCPECGVGKEDFYLLDFVI